MLRFMHHQSWDDALFLHYQVDATKLQALLPEGLVVDTFDQKAYVGVVALTERGIVPTFLPLWLQRLFALSHEAVNVRTYVKPKNKGNGQQGIFFFRLDCTSMAASLGARLLFALPYCLSRMKRTWTEGCYQFWNSMPFQSLPRLEVEWNVAKEERPSQKPDESIGHFFVERYCLYNQPSLILRLFGFHYLWRGSITHRPWPILKTSLVKIKHNRMIHSVPKLAETVVDWNNPVVHFSPGVQDIHFYLERLSEE